jgi:hypothetical protein
VAQSNIEFRYMRGQDEWDWFRGHNKITMTHDTRGLVALRDGKPVAALAMSHFHGYSVEVHQVILKPMIIRHGWIEAMGEAMFGGHVQVVYGIIPENNVKSVKISKHLGMKETGRIPNATEPGIDYVILSLKRRDCRYLKENDDGTATTSG